MTYDAAEMPDALIYPESSGTVEFDFDPAGRLTRLGTPELADHLFQYDTRGLESAYTPPEQPATTRTWDKDKRITRIDEPGGTFRQAAYHPHTGELQTIDHDRGELAFTWNEQTGHLDEVASPSGVVTRYVADGPLLESVEWRRLNQKVGSVSYDYEDGRFRTETVTVAVAGGQGAMAVDYRYDGDGLIEYAGDMSIIRDEQTGRAKNHHLGSTGVKMSYETTYGELTSIETETTLTPPRLSINYATRDALGRITSKAETYRITRNDEDETKTFEYEYGYDSRGRLWTVKVREDGDEQWTREITYGYDGNGNRTQVVTVTAEGTTTQTAKYAADDRLLCMSDGTTLTRFEYTGNGSLETKVAITTEDSCDTVPAPGCYESCETTTYDYDAMGNLLSVVLPDETIIAYDVDAAGRRIAKRVNGTLVKRWLWDGQLRPIAELAPNGSISSLFVYADGVNSPDYMIREGVAYTFVKDHLGSVRMVLDSRNGGIVQAVSYDAWGVPEVVSGELGYQPFGFAGGLYDADAGLVRFGARDYQAEAGRWLAPDPIRFSGGDVNLHAYSGSDPINFMDPDGHAIVNNMTGRTITVSGNIGGGHGEGAQRWGRIPSGTTGGGSSNPIPAYMTRADAIAGRNPVGYITDVDFVDLPSDNQCLRPRSTSEGDHKLIGDDLGPTHTITRITDGHFRVRTRPTEVIDAVYRRLNERLREMFGGGRK